MFNGEVLTMMEVLSRNVARIECCRVTVNNSLTIASLYMSKTLASICAVGVLAKIRCRFSRTEKIRRRDITSNPRV